MGFCSQCGEIVGADQTCAACGYSGAASNPVSGDGTTSSSKSDEYVLTSMLNGMSSIAVTDPAPPHAEAPPFRRNETECGMCAKKISGEAIALDDGRLVHATCFMCARCCVRIAPDGQGKYDYLASGGRVFCSCECAPGAAERAAYDVKDVAEAYSEIEWYFSDGDSSEGPVDLKRLQKLFTKGGLTLDGYVWGSHLPDGADWKPIREDAELCRLLGADKMMMSSGGGGGGGGGGRRAAAPVGGPVGGAAPTPPPPGPDATEAERLAAELGAGGAGLCAGCGKAVGMMALEAIGKQWHSECFKCSVCGEGFPDGAFMAHEGKPMHKACYVKTCAPKCAVCSGAIDGPHVVADGKKIHKACFVCGECGCTLQGGYGMAPDGKPYCGKHLTAAMRKPAPLGAVGSEAAAAAGGAPAPVSAAEAPPATFMPSDPFTIDIRSGEKVYIEADSKRKYRLGVDGEKKYDDEKQKKVLGGGGGSWQTSQVQVAANKGAVGAGQGGFRRV